MKRSLPFVMLVSALSLPTSLRAQPVFRYEGMCDASAAVSIDARHFVVANDEDNVLRIYRRGDAQAVARRDLSQFLGVESESDIEGAAMLGQRTYWISSHGNNRKGKERKDRQRFFFVEFDLSGSVPSVREGGSPYKGLLKALHGSKVLERFKLAGTAALAPESGGLNIEGLAAMRDGKRLLLGLRSPLHDGKALLIPLANPEELVRTPPEEPRFGEPVLLDLGGRGVRSIELVGNSYFISAGPVNDDGSFAVYRWEGGPNPAAQLLPNVRLNDLSVEALFSVPDAVMVQLLSDDGGVRVGSEECKASQIGKRSFRSADIRP